MRSKAIAIMLLIDASASTRSIQNGFIHHESVGPKKRRENEVKAMHHGVVYHARTRRTQHRVNKNFKIRGRM